MRRIILIYLFLIIPAIVYPQDSHNWNIPYGTYSTLLGGAVIGSAYDLSASYYNPGMLSIYNDPGLVIGAQLYNLTKLKIDYESEKNSDLTKNSITPIPGFIAGRIGKDSSASNSFTYSLLGRQLYSTLLEQKFDYKDNSTNRYYDLYINQDIREQWGGFTYSRKLNENSGFGITTYISYRSQDLRYDYSNTGNENNSIKPAFQQKGQYYYWNVSALFKAGYAFKKGPLTTGVTITTPNINILGSGEVYSFKSITGIDSLNLLETNYQDGLKSRHENSFAVGFGFGYDFNSFRLHTSLEWFNAVKPYKTLDAQTFQGQSNGKTIMPEVIASTNSIINYGFGLELFPKSKNQLYLSFNTDNSTIGGSGNSPMLITNYNLKHISAGSIFESSGIKFSLGLAFAWGDKEVESSKSQNSENLITNSNTVLSYRQVSLLFGITFPGKKMGTEREIPIGRR